MNLHTEKVSTITHTHIDQRAKWHLLCGQRWSSQYSVRVLFSTGFVMQIISAGGKISGSVPPTFELSCPSGPQLLSPQSSHFQPGSLGKKKSPSLCTPRLREMKSAEE